MKLNTIVTCLLVCFLLYACKSKKATTTSNASSPLEGNKNVSVIKVETVEGINLGNKAPEIMMAAPKGNVITLS